MRARLEKFVRKLIADLAFLYVESAESGSSMFNPAKSPNYEYMITHGFDALVSKIVEDVLADEKHMKTITDFLKYRVVPSAGGNYNVSNAKYITYIKTYANSQLRKVSQEISGNKLTLEESQDMFNLIMTKAYGRFIQLSKLYKLNYLHFDITLYIQCQYLRVFMNDEDTKILEGIDLDKVYGTTYVDTFHGGCALYDDSDDEAAEDGDKGDEGDEGDEGDDENEEDTDTEEDDAGTEGEVEEA